jgi:hypothetical protein
MSLDIAQLLGGSSSAYKLPQAAHSLPTQLETSLASLLGGPNAALAFPMMWAERQDRNDRADTAIAAQQELAKHERAASANKARMELVKTALPNIAAASQLIDTRDLLTPDGQATQDAEQRLRIEDMLAGIDSKRSGTMQNVMAAGGAPAAYDRFGVPHGNPMNTPSVHAANINAAGAAEAARVGAQVNTTGTTSKFLVPGPDGRPMEVTENNSNRTRTPATGSAPASTSGTAASKAPPSAPSPEQRRNNSGQAPRCTIGPDGRVWAGNKPCTGILRQPDGTTIRVENGYKVSGATK